MWTGHQDFIPLEVCQEIKQNPQVHKLKRTAWHVFPLCKLPSDWLDLCGC